MGGGGVGAHGERSSDDVELAGIRRVRLKGIINDLLTVGGRKKREPAVASCRLQTVCDGACKKDGQNGHEDKHKKSSVHTALCLNRQVSN